VFRRRNPATASNDVFTAEAKARFVETLTGQAAAITSDEIRARFFAYWTNVDSASRSTPPGPASRLRGSVMYTPSGPS